MSKRDAFYSELFDNDGLCLPNDPSQREESVQRLFGATLVNQMDNAIQNALSLIDSQNPYPKTDPPSPLYEEHQVFCDSFRAMTEQQREAIRALVRKTASLMLYGICVKIDQFPGFEVSINLKTLEDEYEPDKPQEEFVVTSPEHEEMHHLYFNWLREFSDHVTD